MSKGIHSGIVGGNGLGLQSGAVGRTRDSCTGVTYRTAPTTLGEQRIPMTKIQLTDIDGLQAADVMHPTASTIDATATVGDLRDYFAASSSRRLAVLVDGDRYVGAICVDDLPSITAPPQSPARDIAGEAPTIAPEASATEARDLALSMPSRRVPVVDQGRLVGIVAIEKHLAAFCGTA
jgi:CBS domain-containing protein